MNDLHQLWLPILVAAVLVFIASSVIHMVFKWHNRHHKKLVNEEEVQAVMRAGAPAPGQYTLPSCSDMKDMQSEAMLKKYRDGPVGFITLIKYGPPNIGGSLIKWFVFNIVVATISAAVALQTYGLDGDSHRAAYMVGILSLLTYTGGSVQAGIWWGKPWGSVALDILDGLIYATVSALAFLWLWP